MYVEENLPTKFSSPLSESDTKCTHPTQLLFNQSLVINIKAMPISVRKPMLLMAVVKEGVMGKKGVMTVMWKSQEENERENGKRSLF